MAVLKSIIVIPSIVIIAILSSPTWMAIVVLFVGASDEGEILSHHALSLHNDIHYRFTLVPISYLSEFFIQDKRSRICG